MNTFSQNTKLAQLKEALESQPFGHNFSVKIKKPKQGVGFSVTINCPPGISQIPLIHSPANSEELAMRTEESCGLIPYSMDFGYQVTTRTESTTKGSCDINIKRNSEYEKKLYEIDSLYKKHICAACINSNTECFAGMTVENDLDRVVENTTFFFTDKNPKYDPKCKITLSKELVCAWSFNGFSKKGKSNLKKVTVKKDGKNNKKWTWENIENLLIKGALVLKCKIKCSYAYINLQAGKFASMGIRAYAHQMIIKDPLNNEDAYDSDIESTDSDNDDGEMDRSTAKRTILQSEGSDDETPNKKMKKEEDKEESLSN